MKEIATTPVSKLCLAWRHLKPFRISSFRFAILPQLKLIWPHSHLANVDYVTMEILFTFEAIWVFPVVSLTHCEP